MMDCSFLFVGSGPVITQKKGPLSAENQQILASYASRTYEKLEACSLFQATEPPTKLEQGLGWLKRWLPGQTSNDDAAQSAKGESSEKCATRIITHLPNQDSTNAKKGSKGQLVCNAVLSGLNPVIAGTVPVVGGIVATGVTAAGKLAYNYAAKPVDPELLPALNFLGVIHRDKDGNFFDNSGTPLHPRDVRKIHQAVKQVELASKLYYTKREEIDAMVSRYILKNDTSASDDGCTGLDGKTFSDDEMNLIKDGIECLESDNQMREEAPVIMLVETLTGHIPAFNMTLEMQEFIEEAVII